MRLKSTVSVKSDKMNLHDKLDLETFFSCHPHSLNSNKSAEEKHTHIYQAPEIESAVIVPCYTNIVKEHCKNTIRRFSQYYHKNFI